MSLRFLVCNQVDNLFCVMVDKTILIVVQKQNI